MGLFDILDSDVPDYNVPSMPEGTREQVHDFTEETLNTSADDLTDQQMEASKGARGLLGKPADQSQMSAQLGGQQNQFLSEAIERKSQRDFSKNQQNLKTQVDDINKDRYFQRLQHAGNLVNKEFQMNERIRLMKYKAKKAKEAARANVLGTLIGVGGALAGAYYGGPGGAMAGQQAGKT